MIKFVALNIAVSRDGFMAGLNQTETAPFGDNGEQLLSSWAWKTRAIREWSGLTGGTTGLEDDRWRRVLFGTGATIMGRNMFGPIRGPWLNNDWKGWWGENPGYKNPVFVLTHYPREPIDMGNGTVFNFVTGGIQQAYQMALDVAGDKNVAVVGGVQTIQQFLEVGLLDELHLVEVPINLHVGELLFSNPALQLNDYQLIETLTSDFVTHKTYLRKID